MAVVAGDIIRTTARFKNAVSGDVVNVFHWLAGSALNELESAVMTAIESKLSAAFANLATYIWTDQDPYDIRHDKVAWIAGKETVVETLGTRSWVLTTPPSSTGEMLPSFNAGIINLRTAYPKTFGRKYLGVFVESQQNGGTLASGVVTAMGSFSTELLNAIVMTSGSLLPGVITYKDAGGDHFAPFTAAVVNAIIGAQRRRRINRGS